MIVDDIGGDTRATGFPRAALPIVLACVVAALALPADRSAHQSLDRLTDVDPVLRLAVPADVPGVRLSVMPDRLLNDQPLSSLTRGVQVRGSSGLASHENGTTTVLWTKDGIAYWLTSSRHGINELVDVADRLADRP